MIIPIWTSLHVMHGAGYEVLIILNYADEEKQAQLHGLENMRVVDQETGEPIAAPNIPLQPRGFRILKAEPAAQ